MTVGISNSLPKLVAYRLLEAALWLPQTIRLLCYQDQFESLLADLVLHKPDVVLADRPVSPGGAMRVFSHLGGESELTLFGTPELAARYGPGFSGSLNGARSAAVAADPQQRNARPHRTMVRGRRPALAGDR